MPCDLMDYRPEELAATARHIAAEAAEPLSCEVGAVFVRNGPQMVAEVVTRDWPAVLDPQAIRDTLGRLFERALDGPLLEQELEAVTDDALGREQDWSRASRCQSAGRNPLVCSWWLTPRNGHGGSRAAASGSARHSPKPRSRS